MKKYIVRLAQERLNDLGSSLVVDGLWGARSQAAYNTHAPSSVGGDSSPFAKAMVIIALGEVGVEEVNGTNTGKRVEEYQAADWLGGTGYPWCASFVCWVYREALTAVTSHPSAKRPRTARAFGFENWAKENKLPLAKPVSGSDTIKAGDIVIFKRSHIGIAVEDSDDGYVRTVEGNTNSMGSREGGGVFRKNRKISKIRSTIRM